MGDNKKTACKNNAIAELTTAGKYFDLVGNMVIGLDRDRNIFFINKAGLVILGVTEAETLKKNWFDNFIPKSERKKMRAVFGSLLSGKADYNQFENTVLVRGGRERLFSWHNLILRDCGKAAGIISSAVEITDYIAVSSELKKSEENFRLLTQSLPIGVYYLDFKGTLLYVNSKAEEITGYKSNEVLKKNILKIGMFRPGEAARIAKNIALDAVGKPVGRQEYELVKKDGSIIPIESDSSIITTDGRKMILGFIRDITDRKTAESEIKHLASFPELNPSPTLELDFAGKITYLNPAAKTLFPDLVAKGRKHPFLAGWTDIERTLQGVSPKIITRDVQIGKSWFEQSISHEPTSRCFRIYSRDRSDHKQAEEALKESELKYRTIVENNNDAFYALDFTGKIIDVNENACRMLGYGREELVGASLSKIDTEKNLKLSVNRMRELTEKGSLVFEGAHLKKDGSAVPVSISTKVVEMDGKCMIQSFVRDITGYKQALSDLEAKNKQLERANKVMVGRELKMVELKKRVKVLEGKL